MLSDAMKRIYEIEDIKSKGVICKVCGKRSEKIKDLGKYCSLECRAVGKKKIPRCKPKCSPENLKSRIVTYINGDNHRQQYCEKCLKTKYLPRDPTLAKRVVLKTRIEKQSDVLQKKYGDSFYVSREWLKLKYKVLKTYGKECMCCGRTEGQLHVDHIKPRSKYPHLQMDFDNLQVLCRDCNFGKGNHDETDFRPKGKKEFSKPIPDIFSF